MSYLKSYLFRQNLSYLVFILSFLFFSPPLLEAKEHLPGILERETLKEELIKGIELLYNWEFQKAETLFHKITQNHPRHPAGYFYMAMVSWSRLASGFWSASNVKEFAERIERTVAVARKMIEKRDGNSLPYFYLGGALGFQGRFELMRQRYLAAYNASYEAIQAFKTCAELDPENQDILLGLGIFDYYTARLSGVLRFLTYLMLHKGDKEEGLRKLHAAAENAVYSNIEAKSQLVHIYLFLEDTPLKALPLAEELAGRFKGNPRFSVFQGVSYLKLGREKAYRDVKDFLYNHKKPEGTEKDFLWSNHALYLESISDLFQEEYGKARSKLESILCKANSHCEPFMAAWPLVKIGMTYDIEGNREKALEFYVQVQDMENGAGAQFLAEKYIRKPAKKGDPFLGY